MAIGGRKPVPEGPREPVSYRPWVPEALVPPRTPAQAARAYADLCDIGCYQQLLARARWLRAQGREQDALAVYAEMVRDKLA